MSLLAENIMQRGVLTVMSDLALEDLEQKFIDERVSGFAVVDESGHLCGVVSRSDIIRHVLTEQSISDVAASFYRDGEHMEPPVRTSDWFTTSDPSPLADFKVSDIMSRELITSSPTEPLLDVARKMNKHRIHRILVTDGNRLAGVITAFDFVHAFADGRIAMAQNLTP